MFVSSPMQAATRGLPATLLERLRARHDFDDLARDRGLADLVHVERQAARSCPRSSCVAVSIAVICAAKNAAFDSSSAR